MSDNISADSQLLLPNRTGLRGFARGHLTVVIPQFLHNIPRQLCQVHYLFYRHSLPEKIDSHLLFTCEDSPLFTLPENFLIDN
jgi:hypothetical protein